MGLELTNDRYPPITRCATHCATPPLTSLSSINMCAYFLTERIIYVCSYAIGISHILFAWTYSIHIDINKHYVVCGGFPTRILNQTNYMYHLQGSLLLHNQCGKHEYTIQNSFREMQGIKPLNTRAERKCSSQSIETSSNENYIVDQQCVHVLTCRQTNSHVIYERSPTQ